MIKNVIFDIGNVLLSYQPKKYLDEKYHDEAVTQRMMNHLFLSQYWLDLDQGVISVHEVVEKLSSEYPFDASKFEEVFSDWEKLLPRIEDTFQLARKLKEAGYHLYLLSNLSKSAHDDIMERDNEFSTLFEGGVFSYAEKVLKPQKEIYEILLERYCLEASECLFLDDVEINVEGAKQCGIHAVVFKDAFEVEKIFHK